MRWQHPVPFSNSDAKCLSKVDASQFGNKCMQFENDGQTTSGSEDCLFMNIWTPSGAAVSSNNRVVMVHFHSGGLMTGSGHESG